MCYLEPGQYIYLTYYVNTNKEVDTDPEATNTVVMPYYNFNGGGVALSAPSITWNNADQYRPNDGSCALQEAADVAALGFTGGDSGTQWLSSQVTVRRGDIKPGLTKHLVSATDSNGVVTENPTSVKNSDILEWELLVDNDGTTIMEDYVLTDCMEAPYRFVGDVLYKSNYAADPITLFTFTDWGDSGVTIETDKGPQTIPLNTKQTITCKNSSNLLGVWFSVDEAGNAVMSLRFQQESWRISPGLGSVLTVHTQDRTGGLYNKRFINTAYVTPVAQTWDHTVNKGNLASYGTPYSEAADSVRNSASAMTIYGYASSSVKGVEEKNVPGNSITSVDGQSYIVLSDVAHEFIYSLTVDNINALPMDMLVLIDRLPEEGDHTVFDANNPRGSEFKVSFAPDPGFEVIVTPQTGEPYSLTTSDYTLEFSDKTEFTDDDWQGAGTDWYSSQENHKTVRLKLNEGTEIPAKSSLTLRFTCKVDDATAQPGEIAWNAFGYRYSMDGDLATLDAAPLKVGVKLPVVPKLTKKLVDHRGAAKVTDTEQTFRFLVCAEDASAISWTTEDELKTALADHTFVEFSVTVPAGASRSEPVMLPENVEGSWQWTRGQIYTVVELPTSDDYEFRSFGVVAKNAYTFTYDPAQDLIIPCTNTGLIWGIDLTKAEQAESAASTDTPLPGAEFALYSPEVADKMADIPAGAAETIEQDGTTWYLHSVKTSDAGGKIAWENLKRESYYLVELKAPDGYKLPSSNRRLLSRADESQGKLAVTVYNHPAGYKLPDAGGTGTTVYTAGGLLLIAAAALLLYRKKVRRKEDFAAS